MGNENNQSKPKYTLELRKDAAQIVLKHGYTLQRAADHLSVSLRAMGCWVKQDSNACT